VDREQQSGPPGTTSTPPAKDAQPKTKSSPRQAKGTGEGPPATTAPDIMSRLPKTRPQRASDRRRSTAARATKSPSARPAGSAKPATASKRPVTTARKRTAAPARATSSTEHGSAPSLPRLAVDGATEAVKLPLKVGGRLTLRALDAVARGLRRG
jgi:hypothetical protein